MIKANSGGCLDYGGSRGTHGQNVLSWECGTDNVNQHVFWIESEEAGWFYMRTPSGAFLDAGDGTNLYKTGHTWSSTQGNDNTKFKYNDDKKTIESKVGGCLDNSGGQNGANYYRNKVCDTSNSNQQFDFESLDS